MIFLLMLKTQTLHRYNEKNDSLTLNVQFEGESVNRIINYKALLLIIQD